MNAQAGLEELRDDYIDYLVRYWTQSDPAYLQGMGVDTAKLPQPADFRGMLEQQLHLPLEQKRSYCLIWLLDKEPIGHCNTNPTFFRDHAFMHLHIWKPELRGKGWSGVFLPMAIRAFFRNLQLQRLISEPYALNPAPHKALEKAGFILEKEYVTTPGSINFEQPVKRWVLERDRFDTLYRES